MDTYPDDIQLVDNNAELSYDDNVPYEEQISTDLLEQPLQADGLFDRIGINKMYLISDSKLPGIELKKSGSGKVRVWFLGWINCG